MSSWDKDLKIEEARVRLVYQMLYGFLNEDIRTLHIPGDIRTGMKRGNYPMRYSKGMES